MDLRMKKSRLWMLAAILLCCTMAVLTSCKSKSTADLVVYGKIFTSDNNQIVEAASTSMLATRLEPRSLLRKVRPRSSITLARDS